MPPALSILVVDDDELHRWTWKKTLEHRYGARVRVSAFDRARAALKCLEDSLDGEVPLILLDWHMPDLGAEGFLAEAARKGIGPARIVLFSGSDLSLLEAAFGTAGCLALVEKGRADQEEALFQVLDAVVKGPA